MHPSNISKIYQHIGSGITFRPAPSDILDVKVSFIKVITDYHSLMLAIMLVKLTLVKEDLLFKF